MTVYELNDRDTAAELFTRASHAMSDRAAQRLFEDAWLIAEPSLRPMVASIIRKALGEDDSELTADAMTLTAVKLWVHLRGNETTSTTNRTIGAGLVVTAARGAANGEVDRHKRHARNNYSLTQHGVDGSFMDQDENRALAVDDPGLEVDDTLEHLARVAITEHRKPQWARLIGAFAEGHHRPVDIAHALGMNENTVRFHLMQLRRSGLIDRFLTGETHTPEAVHQFREMLQLVLFDVPQVPIPQKKPHSRRTTPNTSAEQISLLGTDSGVVL
jgi:hypothetical protein